MNKYYTVYSRSEMRRTAGTEHCKFLKDKLRERPFKATFSLFLLDSVQDLNLQHSILISINRIVKLVGIRVWHPVFDPGYVGYYLNEHHITAALIKDHKLCYSSTTLYHRRETSLGSHNVLK